MDGIDWGRVIGKALGAGFLILIIYLGIWVWDITKKAGKKGIEVGKQALDQAKDRLDGMPDSGNRYDDLYAVAYQEMSSTNRDAASWAKAFAHASGDNERAKALYIKYRVEQLKHSQTS